jgi:hypothetical protein
MFLMLSTEGRKISLSTLVEEPREPQKYTAPHPEKHSLWWY